MRVVTAKDGLEAVSVLQDEVPDVILLDIEMPRMDGYEVASHVRNDVRLKDVPIVMITSRVGEKHRARAIELGVNEYLGKPYQEGQLLQAIEPLVRQGGDVERGTGTLRPAGAAARRAAAGAARLRRRGHELPAAAGDAGRAALVPRHPVLERPGRAGRVLRGRLRQAHSRHRRPHAHRDLRLPRAEAAGRALRHRDPGLPAARAREPACDRGRTSRAPSRSARPCSARCAWSTSCR